MLFLHVSIYILDSLVANMYIFMVCKKKNQYEVCINIRNVRSNS